MSVKTALTQSRGSIEVRSQALSQLLGSLSTLEQSLHEATLPEFTSVIKPKTGFIVAPNLYEEEDWLLRQAQDTLLPGPARPRSLTPTAMKADRLLGSFSKLPRNLHRPMWRAARATRKHAETPDPKVSIPRWPGLDTGFLCHSTLSLSKILQRTGSLEKYKPAVAQQSLKAKAVREDLHACEIRQAKQELYQQKQHRQLEELQARVRKYEWRQRTQEIMQGKKRWIGIFAYITSVRLWSVKQVRRKVASI